MERHSIEPTGCSFCPFFSHHLRTLRTGSSDDQPRNGPLPPPPPPPPIFQSIQSFWGKTKKSFHFFPPQVFLCGLCLLAVMLPAASSCPPPCLCYSDGLVDCRGRGLLSLPPLHLLPPGSLSLLLANNNLASLGASAFANLSSLEVSLFDVVKADVPP